MSQETRPGPVATATSSVLDWLSGANVPARLAPPGPDPRSSDTAGEPDAPAQVRLWPMALLPEQATRHTHDRAPLRLRVRYLIAAGAPGASSEPHSPAALFDRIVTASVSDSSVHVVLEPVPADVWRGFGLPPQLGLYVDVPVQVAPRSRPASPRVRAPLRLEARALRNLHGTVVGPGGVPVPGVRVVVPETGAAAYTGNRGQFAFPALPAGGPVRLHLTGRGRELVAEVAGHSDEPIVIHCDLEGE